MFRMPPQVDPAEDTRRVRAEVRNNVVVFAVLCAAIRIIPLMLERAPTA